MSCWCVDDVKQIIITRFSEYLLLALILNHMIAQSNKTYEIYSYKFLKISRMLKCT
uniref:Uncharacterized protein n=2 Tax=Anguilla anguilla TaxID=7936 RepID=A0A0E9SGI2_ANGAN